MKVLETLILVAIATFLSTVPCFAADPESQDCSKLNSTVCCATDGCKYVHCPKVPSYACIKQEETKEGCEEDNSCPTDCDVLDYCENGGTCTQTDDHKTCACAGDFIGDTCEKEPCGDDENDCENDGTCTKVGDDKTCTCKEGFSGDNCEMVPCGDDENECKNDATCTKDEGGKQKCTCKEGFSGDKCENEPCGDEENDCQNDGTCTKVGDDKTCTCKLGFAGEKCETDVCKDHCENGGTCSVVDDNVLQCECATGYTGDTCAETEMQCTDMKNKTSCCQMDGCSFYECSDDGQKCVSDDNPPKGEECSGKTDICADGCSGLTCANEGACVYLNKDSAADVRCACAEGFKGEKCEEKVEAPAPQPQHKKGSGQRFDAASFIGGIVLAVGLIIIVVVGFKFYRRKKDPVSRYSQF